MGWNNPPIPWSELERTLSGRRRPRWTAGDADGGDSPAWSRKRGPYVAPDGCRARPATSLPYAELHAHSSFSFLDGASTPEELLEEAERLGLHALAVTDHDGFYGIVRFAEAAEKSSVQDGVRRRALARAGASRRTASPTPRAPTCSCSPGGRRATTGSRARSPRRSCAAARRAARSTTSTSSPSARAGTG